MRPKRRSSGVATDDAMVSGLAPGSAALTLDGREVDARQRRDRQRVYAASPASSTAAASSDVAIGRRMNGAEMFIGASRTGGAPTRAGGSACRRVCSRKRAARRSMYR